MDLQSRNNVRTVGNGPITLCLAHGYGCDQNMWRLLVPLLSEKYTVLLFDHVGCGRSDVSLYDPERYATLHGYAEDLVEVAALADKPRVLIGHSVSAMIGLLAELKSPGLFDAHVMIGPSPSYINDGSYVGGFERADIDELLTTLEGNYLGWASSMAPSIMGNADRPELAEELNNSFCQTDPDIAARFARATFLSNNLADLPKLAAPTLVLQNTNDFIAPVPVGEHVSRTVQNGALRLVENVGHCPHLSAPETCAVEIDAWLDTLTLRSAKG